jgi:hypothetical protein
MRIWDSSGFAFEGWRRNLAQEAPGWVGFGEFSKGISSSN